LYTHFVNLDIDSFIEQHKLKGRAKIRLTALAAALNAAGNGNYYLREFEDCDSVVYGFATRDALESFIAELTVQGLGDLIAPASASSSKIKSTATSLSRRGSPWRAA
jgi:hypothetical protein